MEIRVGTGESGKSWIGEKLMEDKMNGMEIKEVIIDEACKMTEEDYKRLKELRNKKEARLAALKPICSDCEHVMPGCSTICNKYPQRKPRDVARLNSCVHKLKSLEHTEKSNMLFYCDPELNITCRKTNCKLLGTGDQLCDCTSHIEFAKKPIEKVKLVLPYDKELEEAVNGTEDQSR